MVSEMRKEGLVTGTVIIVGKRLDWGILYSVELRVVNRLCTSSRTWWDAGAVWMVGSCQQASRLLDFLWSSGKNRPCNAMVD